MFFYCVQNIIRINESTQNKNKQCYIKHPVPKALPPLSPGGRFVGGCFLFGKKTTFFTAKTPNKLQLMNGHRELDADCQSMSTYLRTHNTAHIM